LSILSDFQPDVLVSDLRMPGKDGIDLLKEVRARGIDVPAAALTALASPEDEERSEKAGFQVHLAKPVEPSSLASAIAQLGGTRNHNHRVLD
jgi:CheY-like chemotaxis protein